MMFGLKLAEGRGFEPREVVNLAGFQNQCFRPLSHPSNSVALAIKVISTNKF